MKDLIIVIASVIIAFIAKKLTSRRKGNNQDIGLSDLVFLWSYIASVIIINLIVFVLTV